MDLFSATVVGLIPKHHEKAVGIPNNWRFCSVLGREFAKNHVGMVHVDGIVDAPTDQRHSDPITLYGGP